MEQKKQKRIYENVVNVVNVTKIQSMNFVEMRHKKKYDLMNTYFD